MSRRTRRFQRMPEADVAPLRARAAVQRVTGRRQSPPRDFPRVTAREVEDAMSVMSAPRPDPGTGAFLNEREKAMVAEAQAWAEKYLPRHLALSAERDGEFTVVRCSCRGGYSALAAGGQDGLQAARLAHVLRWEGKK